MHFHCSHWQNHLLNFKFREKGPLVLVKTTFSSLFWNKLLIPHANCNGHVPFDMFYHIRSQNGTLGFFGRKYLSEQHWQMRHIRLHGCTDLKKEMHHSETTKKNMINLIVFCWNWGLSLPLGPQFLVCLLYIKEKQFKYTLSCYPQTGREMPCETATT